MYNFGVYGKWNIEGIKHNFDIRCYDSQSFEPLFFAYAVKAHNSTGQLIYIRPPEFLFALKTRYYHQIDIQTIQHVFPCISGVEYLNYPEAYAKDWARMCKVLEDLVNNDTFNYILTEPKKRK